MGSPEFESAQQVGNLWMDYLTRMGTAAMAFAPGDAPADAGRTVRDAGFATMSQCADRFMRSPEFLAMMKQSIEAATSFRQQLNDLFTQAHHSVQGVARQDVDAVTGTVRRSETRILARLEELCGRIDDLGRRLDTLEQHDRLRNGQAHDESQAAPRLESES